MSTTTAVILITLACTCVAVCLVILAAISVKTIVLAVDDEDLEPIDAAVLESALQKMSDPYKNVSASKLMPAEWQKESDDDGDTDQRIKVAPTV